MLTYRNWTKLVLLMLFVDRVSETKVVFGCRDVDIQTILVLLVKFFQLLHSCCEGTRLYIFYLYLSILGCRGWYRVLLRRLFYTLVVLLLIGDDMLLSLNLVDTSANILLLKIEAFWLYSSILICKVTSIRCCIIPCIIIVCGLCFDVRLWSIMLLFFLAHNGVP